MARSTSFFVFAQPTLNLMVPVGNVPSVLCAEGAQ